MLSKIKKLIFFKIILILFFCYTQIFFSPTPTNAQTKDAIAIRVLPNPTHLSPSDWYKSQKFTGSPQSLLVDGYEAIRDGRTVYANAANIIGNNLNTNIYVISYTQGVEQATIDIFGRIIKQWKFNTNIDSAGFCYESGKTPGDFSCALDQECPNGEYCTSEKSQVVRDVKRLSDLAGINIRLEEYKTANSIYPNLKSGTYLPQITISTWPSWQKLLAQSLKTNLPDDPINHIGDCGDPRFNDITCWDEKQKQFSEPSVPAPNDDTLPTLALPTGANAYLYTASPNGAKYRLCAAMETSYVNIVGCSGTETPNSPPSFTGYNFPLNYAEDEYKGYLEAIDPDGDALTWSFYPLNNAFAVIAVWPGWEAANMPILRAASVFKQKQIYSPKAGLPGIYNFTAVVEDGRGGSASQNFYLTISNPKPKILQPLGCVRTVRVNSPYPSCIITATHPYNPVTAITVNSLPSGISIRQLTTGLTATAEIYGTPGANSSGSYNIELVARESGNTSSNPAKFSLEVSNYCGDGRMQKPNSEKRGGPKDDGNESCDTNDNIAVSAIDSNLNKQYSCDNNCTYAGGYCGNNNTEIPQEECDDGKNGNNADTCYDDCKNTYCGDGIIQNPNGRGQNEECDGYKLNNQTCQRLGFQFGTLACTSGTCQFDDNSCCNPTDGAWSAWVDGVCRLNSGTYGPGVTTQTRTCTLPTCGGKNCQGTNIQTAACCVPATCSNFAITNTMLPYSDGCGGTIHCCNENSWTPLANTVCIGDTFTQTSNCGNTRSGIAGALSADDGNECTIDTCSGGVISHVNRPEETPCAGGNVCRSGRCVPPCRDVIKYSHPSKTCTNGYQTCTTPNLPDSYLPLSTSPGATQFTGCGFGYFGYPEGSPRHVLCIVEPPPYYNNQYCTTDAIPRGTFDFAEGRIMGVHEAGLLCYPQNVQITVCE